MVMSSALAEPTSRAIACEVVSFDGTRIAYDLYDHTSRTLVLVVPGFWRFRRHPSMTGFAALLNDLGYRAAIIDPRGHGESGGTYGFNLHEHHDVAAVASDLLRRFPSTEGICLIGLSYGGAIAISAAARNALPFKSLLLISPVAEFSSIVPRLNPLTLHRHIAWSQAFHRPRFVLRRSSEKLEAIHDIKQVHVPVAFVHVKDDWLINHKHSERLYAAANEPKELHVLDIPGQFHADHIFKVAGDRVTSIVGGFLDAYAPR
jgi:alpha-beta hydrolase superfamily lysophospholipase